MATSTEGSTGKLTTLLPPTSFAKPWLVSGREDLPGLVSNSDDGRDGNFWDNSVGEGTEANSEEPLQISFSNVNG